MCLSSFQVSVFLSGFSDILPSESVHQGLDELQSGQQRKTLIPVIVKSIDRNNVRPFQNFSRNLTNILTNIFTITVL